jgi:hypothetical protein
MKNEFSRVGLGNHKDIYSESTNFFIQNNKKSVLLVLPCNCRGGGSVADGGVVRLEYDCMLHDPSVSSLRSSTPPLKSGEDFLSLKHLNGSLESQFHSSRVGF